MKNRKFSALLKTPAGAVIAVGMLAIVVELLIMVVVENVFPLSMHEFLYLFDPILLIVIVSSALYFLVFRPMRKQQAELEGAHKEIEGAFQEWITALDAVNDPIFLHDKDFRILRCNKAYQQCAGLPFKQLIGQPYYEVFPKNHGPLPSCGRAMEKEEEEVTAGGAIYHSRAYSIHDEQGAYLYSIHTFEDITISRRAEMALQESEEKFRKITESAQDAIIMMGADRRISFWNTAATRIFAYTSEEALGKEMHTLIAPPQAYAAFAQGFTHFQATGKGPVIDKVIGVNALRKGGEEFPVELSISATQLSGQWHAIGIVRDISERKQAEAIRTRLMEHLESSPDFVGFADACDAHILYINRAGRAMTGIGEDEDVAQLKIPDVHPAWTNRMLEEVIPPAAVRTGGWQGECAFLHRDGHEIPVSMVLRAHKSANGAIDVFSTTSRDITERKQAQEKLQRSEAGLNEAQRLGMLGNWELDIVNNAFTWSDEIYRIFEIDRAVSVASSDVFLNVVHPDDREMVNKAYTNSLRERTPYDIVHRLLMGDGRVKYVHEICQTSYGGDGKPLSSIGTVQDITELKQAEIAIQHANRALATLSAVNRILVHATDENELLQAICEAIVEQKGYRMAWVGYVQYDAVNSIKLMAHASYNGTYPDTMQPTWAEEGQGMGPSGRAVRSGTTQTCQDIASDPHYRPWRDEALERGYLSSIALPLAHKEVFGVLAVYAEEVNAFNPGEISLLEEMAGDLSFGVRTLHTRRERDRAMEQSRQQLAKLESNLEDTVRAIATIVEMRDPYTAGHQSRVSDLATAIAAQMGLSAERVQAIQLAGIVHDLGKIKIPAEILSKPGKISDIEYSLIKIHPQAGYDILKGIDFPWPIAQMVLQHHERLDGSGYPQGLKGETILLEARILMVADVVEAISSHRPYRPGLGTEVGLEEIIKNRGKFYDPQVVDACLTLFRERGYSL